MREYEANSKIYVDVKDIRDECKDYCKGIRSSTQLIARKGIRDFIYGKIDNDRLIVTEKYSRKLGSIFINKAEIGFLFETTLEQQITETPPLIEDDDLVFFKDDNGKEYQVPMRGSRTRDGIYFQVKGVMWAFDMTNLIHQLFDKRSSYTYGEHYVSFNVRESGLANKCQNTEPFLTYNGLLHAIEVGRSGVGSLFKNWIHEVVFTAAWGTKAQKVKTFSKILNADADHLKCIMSKTPMNISCLYLIDIGRDNNGKKLFKYGFTENVSRRFKEHMRRYGESIALDTFILIPILELSKAETEFKNSVSRYRFEEDGENELIELCGEAYINIKTIFRTISEKHTGNMSAQIAQYENQIKDLRHSNDMLVADLNHQLTLKDKDLELSRQEIYLRDKDIEILSLKLQMAQR